MAENNMHYFGAEHRADRSRHRDRTTTTFGLVLAVLVCATLSLGCRATTPETSSEAVRIESADADELKSDEAGADEAAATGATDREKATEPAEDPADDNATGNDDNATGNNAATDNAEGDNATGNNAATDNAEGDNATDDNAAGEETAEDTAAEPASDAAVVGADGAVTSPAYAFQSPPGWNVDPAAEGPYPGMDVSILNLEDTDDGFTDNFSVFPYPTGLISADTAETAAMKDFAAAGLAEGSSVKDRVDVGGIESPHLEVTGDFGFGLMTLDQFYLNATDQTYVLTFSFSPSVTETERAAAYEAVLSTWEWR